MEIANLLSLSIVGFLVSGMVQYFKNKYQTKKDETLLLLGGISILVAVALHFITSNGLLPTVFSVLTVASAFHNLVIRKFESNSSLE